MRRDGQERGAVGDLRPLELLFEAPGQLRDVARRAIERLERAGGDAAEPQLTERCRECPGKAGEPRDGREVGERPLPQRLEADPRGDRLGAERRGRRHAEPGHLRGGKAHGQLGEARAVQPEGRASRQRDPSGQVVRRVAGGADDQDFRSRWKALEEDAGGAEPLGGGGRLGGLEHCP